MKYHRIWLALCLLSVLSPAIFAVELKVIRKEHPMDRYTIDALKLTLSQLDSKYTLTEIPEEVTQERTIEMVKEGRIDVYWMASSSDIEEQLMPIRFPLMKGLLGHRINIIRPDMQQKFGAITTIDDVKKLKFGQGTSWPDTVILRDNGINVVTCNKYQGLFHMVEGGRFDAFPRAVLEAWSETSERPELSLAVEKDLLFIYRLPVYFFVREDRKELAADLMRGLELSLANGSFDNFFFNNPQIKDALEKSNLKSRKAFYLQNPFLSPETPLERKDYWLNVEELKI